MGPFPDFLHPWTTVQATVHSRRYLSWDWWNQRFRQSGTGGGGSAIAVLMGARVIVLPAIHTLACTGQDSVVLSTLQKS